MRVVALIAVSVSAAALADDRQVRAAQEELEQQLKAMLVEVPAKVKVNYVPVNDLNYRLVDAEFLIDGKPVKAPPASALGGEEPVVVYSGDLAGGNHRLESKLTIQNGASFMVEKDGGYTWRVGSTVSFVAHKGVEVVVNVTPVLDRKARDLKDRFTVRSPAQATMLARLDDGTTPAPLPKPTLAAAPEKTATDAAAGTVAETPKTKQGVAERSGQTASAFAPAVVAREDAPQKRARADRQSRSPAGQRLPPPEIQEAVPTKAVEARTMPPAEAAAPATSSDAETETAGAEDAGEQEQTVGAAQATPSPVAAVPAPSAPAVAQTPVEEPKPNWLMYLLAAGATVAALFFFLRRRS